MQLACGCSAYHYWYVQPGFRQFVRHIDHLFETWSDESAKPDDVHVFLLSFLHNLFCRHHHTHVNHFIVVAGQDYTHNVLAYVMHVALYGGQENLSGLRAAVGFLRFNVRLQYLYGLFHGAGGLHYLRKKHLAASEQFAHGVHSGHQRAFDDAYCLGVFGQRLGQVLFQKLSRALYQCIGQPFLQRTVAPFGCRCRGFAYGFTVVLRCLGLLLDFRSEVGESFGSSCGTVQYGIFQYVQFVVGYFTVSDLRCWVDYSEVHAHFDGMKEKHCVHGLADIVVAAKRKRQVTDASADVCARQIGANPFRCAYEVGSIGVVLLHSRGYGQHIRVENDVERVHTHTFREYFVGTRGYLDAPFKGRGLSFFVETHDHSRSSVAFDVMRMADKHVLSLLE